MQCVTVCCSALQRDVAWVCYNARQCVEAFWAVGVIGRPWFCDVLECIIAVVATNCSVMQCDTACVWYSALQYVAALLRPWCCWCCWNQIPEQKLWRPPVVCVCVYVCVNECACWVYVRDRLWPCVCVCKIVCIYMRMCMQACIYLYITIHTWAHVYIYIYMYIYIHVYKHIFIYICIQKYCIRTHIYI